MADKQKLTEFASSSVNESRQFDFKQGFDSDSLEAWCGLIKDIVAMANSGGGLIIFGVSDDGQPSGIDVSHVMHLDPADITNKVAKYTNFQFSEFEVFLLFRNTQQLPAIFIDEAEVPIVFTKPGTYPIADGKQKTAFSQGTVYFRHGSKSEPGTRDDLKRWFDKEIKKARRSWLTGIRKVVEAPPDHVVNVLPAVESGYPGAFVGRITLSTDPKAVALTPQNAEEIWPHRQKDLLTIINAKLPAQYRINGHDIFCINRLYEIPTKHPEFSYKPHHLVSPQYSEGFADWILDQYTSNPEFFRETRNAYKAKTKEN